MYFGWVLDFLSTALQKGGICEPLSCMIYVFPDWRCFLPCSSSSFFPWYDKTLVAGAKQLYIPIKHGFVFLNSSVLLSHIFSFQVSSLPSGNIEVPENTSSHLTFLNKFLICRCCCTCTDPWQGSSNEQQERDVLHYSHWGGSSSCSLAQTGPSLNIQCRCHSLASSCPWMLLETWATSSRKG